MSASSASIASDELDRVRLAAAGLAGDEEEEVEADVEAAVAQAGAGR